MANPNKVDVYVTLNTDKTYSMRAVPDVFQNGELSFNNNGRPGFWVYFHIDDPHGMGYLFPDRLSDAMYSAKLVNAGDGCPSSGTWGGFEPKLLEDQDPNTGRYKTIKVRDPNVDKYVGRFGYTLRVVKTLEDGTDDWWSLDPVGSNNNGPTQVRFFSATTLAVAAVGAAIGAVAARTVDAAATPARLVTYAVIGAVIALAIFFILRGSQERAV